MFKVEGILGKFGTPKWVDYYCSVFCLEKEGFQCGDAEQLTNDDLKPQMYCRHCNRSLIDVITDYGRFPAEMPRN